MGWGTKDSLGGYLDIVSTVGVHENWDIPLKMEVREPTHALYSDSGESC